NFRCFCHEMLFFCAKTRWHNSVFPTEKIVGNCADLAKNRVNTGMQQSYALFVGSYENFQYQAVRLRSVTLALISCCHGMLAWPITIKSGLARVSRRL